MRRNLALTAMMICTVAFVLLAVWAVGNISLF
jgi:hypothetical protein